MKLCRVAGTVITTAKHPTFEGQKLMVVQPIDVVDNDNDNSFLAVDRVQAGVGDKVLVLSEGTGSRQLFKMTKSPIRSVIVGVVDSVDCE